MDKEKNTTIEKAIKAMAQCDMYTLTAALALLPEYMNDGEGVVIGAAARVIAERFSDTSAALERFGEIVRMNKSVMEERTNEH